MNGRVFRDRRGSGGSDPQLSPTGLLPRAHRRRKPRARVRLRGDRLVGLLDGMRGLPTPASGMATARQLRIAHWASVKAQSFVSHYGPLLSDLRDAREHLTAHCEAQTGLLEDAKAVAARIQQEGPSGGRRFGEFDLTDDQVLRRRASEFERALSDALTSLRRQQAVVGSGQAAVRACEDRLSVLEDELRSDLQRIHALAGRRRRTISRASPPHTPTETRSSRASEHARPSVQPTNRSEPYTL